MCYRKYLWCSNWRSCVHCPVYCCSRLGCCHRTCASNGITFYYISRAMAVYLPLNLLHEKVVLDNIRYLPSFFCDTIYLVVRMVNTEYFCDFFFNIGPRSWAATVMGADQRQRVRACAMVLQFGKYFSSGVLVKKNTRRFFCFWIRRFGDIFPPTPDQGKLVKEKHF